MPTAFFFLNFIYRKFQLKFEIGEKFKELEEKKKFADKFWEQIEEMETWIRDALAQLDSVAEAKIYKYFKFFK